MAKLQGCLVRPLRLTSSVADAVRAYFCLQESGYAEDIACNGGFIDEEAKSFKCTASTLDAAVLIPSFIEKRKVVG